jgi:hypothetical protein
MHPGSVKAMADIESADSRQRQGVYLTASGTLVQFNAIVAAIQGSTIASGVQGLLKLMAAGGLALHVLGAVVLCWAVRPVVDSTEQSRVRLDRYIDATDRVMNYRSGWRVTLLALAVSSATAALFVLHAFGVFWSRF